MNIEPRRRPLERSVSGIAPGGSCKAAGVKQQRGWLGHPLCFLRTVKNKKYKLCKKM